MYYFLFLTPEVLQSMLQTPQFYKYKGFLFFLLLFTVGMSSENGSRAPVLKTQNRETTGIISSNPTITSAPSSREASQSPMGDGHLNELVQVQQKTTVISVVVSFCSC